MGCEGGQGGRLLGILSADVASQEQGSTLGGARQNRGPMFRVLSLGEFIFPAAQAGLYQ